MSDQIQTISLALDFHHGAFYLTITGSKPGQHSEFGPFETEEQAVAKLAWAEQRMNEIVAAAGVTVVSVTRQGALGEAVKLKQGPVH